MLGVYLFQFYFFSFCILFFHFERCKYNVMLNCNIKLQVTPMFFKAIRIHGQLFGYSSLSNNQIMVAKFSISNLPVELFHGRAYMFTYCKPKGILSCSFRLSFFHGNVISNCFFVEKILSAFFYMGCTKYPFIRSKFIIKSKCI